MVPPPEPTWTKGNRREYSRYFLNIGKRHSRVRLYFGKVYLGRHPKMCNVIFNHPTISRRHCVINTTQTGITIEDLGSRNGTRVNGQQIQQVELHVNDVIKVGAVRMLLLEENEPTEPEIRLSSAREPDSDDMAATLESESFLELLPGSDLDDIPPDLLDSMFDD